MLFTLRIAILTVSWMSMFWMFTLSGIAAYAADDALVATLLSEKRCAGCDLSGIDLAGANLIGADLSGANLEGTNFTAKNLPNALSVLAVTKRGNLLHAPDIYMEKIAIGSNLPKNIIDLDFGIKKNIELLSEAKNLKPNKLTACVLKRSRHNSIIKVLTEMNVKINYITDGDVSGVISVAESINGIDIYLGVGGGPEGVLAAAALSCLGCQMQTRLVFQNNDEKNRARKLGIINLSKKYDIKDMVKGDVIFCATGVTDGDLVKGIRDLGDYFASETLVLHKSSKTNKILKNRIKK